MSLVPSVTELILAEFLYVQYEDDTKPIYLYINSIGTTKGGEKLGYETKAFAIYDVISHYLELLNSRDKYGQAMKSTFVIISWILYMSSCLHGMRSSGEIFFRRPR
ncbi:hypothetical protein ACFX2H_036374 [Malus domestica]